MSQYLNELIASSERDAVSKYMMVRKNHLLKGYSDSFKRYNEHRFEKSMPTLTMHHAVEMGLFPSFIDFSETENASDRFKGVESIRKVGVNIEDAMKVMALGVLVRQLTQIASLREKAATEIEELEEIMDLEESGLEFGGWA